MIEFSVFALTVLSDEDVIWIVKYCQGLEPWSWEWMWRSCWMYSSDAAAMGLSGVGALLSAKVLRWFIAGR